MAYKILGRWVWLSDIASTLILASFVVAVVVFLTGLVVAEADLCKPGKVGRFVKKYVGWWNEFTPENRDLYDREHGFGKYRERDL